MIRTLKFEFIYEKLSFEHDFDQARKNHKKKQQEMHTKLKKNGKLISN
jgi:hypothetical protein